MNLSPDQSAVEQPLPQVIDRTGKAINQGDRVLVFQEEGTYKATVIEPFPDIPTSNQPGNWVDIKKDGESGYEGMMSYILEVIDE